MIDVPPGVEDLKEGGEPPKNCVEHKGSPSGSYPEEGYIRETPEWHNLRVPKKCPPCFLPGTA